MTKEYCDKIYEKYFDGRSSEYTPETFSEAMESAETDFEKKVIIVSVFDIPNKSVNTLEWKVALRKYSKEILEIRSDNRKILDESTCDLEYTLGWYPEEVKN